MQIYITKSKQDSVSFMVDECGDQFYLRLDENRNLYVTNRHVRIGDEKGNSNTFGENPMKFTLDDLPVFEEVIEHWKKIRPNFVSSVAHGNSVGGHESTTYTYPDGRSVNYKVRDPRKPKGISGKPFDTRFPSDGCGYFDDHPLQQHYKQGRFDFYLEKSTVTVEDDKHIEILEDKQPETVLELLRFIARDSTINLSRLSSGTQPLESRLDDTDDT